MKLLLPPPIFFKIINKTAFYVSKHGKIFEKKIKKKYKKFTFFDNKNIFYPYYIYKLKLYLYEKKKKNNTQSFNKKTNKNLLFVFFFNNLSTKKYKLFLNTKNNKKIYQLISTIKIFIHRHNFQSNFSQLINNFMKIFDFNLSTSCLAFIQIIYQFIKQNHHSLKNLVKLIKFNKIEILQNEIKKKKIQKFKNIFNSKNFISKKIYTNMISWENFVVVKTIDFIETNTEKLGKPFDLKQLI
uniref:Splicing factor 3A subunit n=1 Tax=Lotharella vacuolata TaxID=74820 RepID=A0A0H5BKU5_9EUKA|nr:splicing factor 3A subunit [Lotharella vacuolata]